MGPFIVLNRGLKILFYVKVEALEVASKCK